jgi:O-antigen ligase
LFLCSTASRGSILGIIAGIISYFFYVKRKTFYIYLSVIIVILVQSIILYYTYPYYRDNLQINTDINLLKKDFDITSTKQNNIYLRAYENWPRCLFAFTHSPILGAGFGSVNDIPFHFDKHSVNPFNNGDKIFNNIHGHHSYLHILAEEGVIGLTLFLLFWLNLFKYITSPKRMFPNFVRIFLIISFFNLVFMSFTEHRITTPSNVFPFVLILVLALMYDNSQNRNFITKQIKEVSLKFNN